MTNGAHVRAFRRVIRHGTLPRIARMVEKRPSDETAELMACLSRPEAGRVAQALVASDRASGPLARLSQPLLRDVLTFLSPSELGRLIGASALDLEQAVLYFSLVPVERQPLVLDELSAERRAHVNECSTTQKTALAP